MTKSILRCCLIAILSIGLFLFAACDNNDKDSNGINDPSNPESIEDWPSDLPAFNYGTFVTSHYDEYETFIGATYTNIANPQEAFDGYKAALTAAGWTFDTDASNDVTFAAAFTKGEKGILFSVVKDGTMANIMYAYD